MGYHAQLHNHLLFSLTYGKNLLSAAVAVTLCSVICSVKYDNPIDLTLRLYLPRSAERASVSLLIFLLFRFELLFKG